MNTETLESKLTKILTAFVQEELRLETDRVKRVALEAITGKKESIESETHAWFRWGGKGWKGLQAPGRGIRSAEVPRVDKSPQDEFAYRSLPAKKEPPRTTLKDGSSIEKILSYIKANPGLVREDIVARLPSIPKGTVLRTLVKLKKTKLIRTKGKHRSFRFYAALNPKA